MFDYKQRNRSTNIMSSKSTSVSTVMWTTSVIVFMLALFGLGQVKANADILDRDAKPSVKLYVSALDYETIEVIWSAPEPQSIRNWILLVSKTPRKADSTRLALLDGNISRHVFTGLSANQTYYVFIECIGSNERYIVGIASPEKVKMPGRVNVTDTNNNGLVERAAQEKSQSSGTEEEAVVTQPPTAGGVVVTSSTSLPTKPPDDQDANMVLEEAFPAQALNSTQVTSPMPTNYTYTHAGGSRGSEVAKEQQKTLLKWVLITGGAGLGLIIVSSVLSLLCYKPLRKKEDEDVTLRKKPSTSDAEGNGGKEGDDQGTSRQHKELHVPPHLGISDIVPSRPSNRAAGSVISWGSEFDVLDSVSENIYNNDQPSPNQPTMTNTGTAPSLPPPRVQARAPRPLPNLPKLLSTSGRNASGLISKIKNRLSGESFRHHGDRRRPDDGDVYNNSNPERVFYMSGNKPSVYQNSDLSADGGYVSESSTVMYDNNISNDTWSAGGDIYINSDLALRGNQGYMT